MTNQKITSVSGKGFREIASFPARKRAQKSRSSIRKFSGVILSILTIGMFSGHSQMAFALESQTVFTSEVRASLEERVKAEWDAQVEGDWAKVYEFLTPQTKKRVSREKFLSVDKPLVFESYRIGDVKIDQDKATVQITAKYSLAEYPVSQEETFWRNWAKIDGVWYELDVGSKGGGVEIAN